MIKTLPHRNLRDLINALNAGTLTEPQQVYLGELLEAEYQSELCTAAVLFPEQMTREELDSVPIEPAALAMLRKVGSYQ